MKNTRKISGKILNEIKISNLPDKELKMMAIKMFTKLERRKDEHSENFNKDTERKREYQTEVTELKNTVTELKNTLEGLNNRLDEAEERIGESNIG